MEVESVQWSTTIQFNSIDNIGDTLIILGYRQNLLRIEATRQQHTISTVVGVLTVNNQLIKHYLGI
jgi:hypothetical protein